jgi:hypothetical protein
MSAMGAAFVAFIKMRHVSEIAAAKAVEKRSTKPPKEALTGRLSPAPRSRVYWRANQRNQ